MNAGLIATDWANFLAGFGGIQLTFLAGTEIDSLTIKNYWKDALSIE
jgi:Kef-type K+ transport system membrane component KefB